METKKKYAQKFGIKPSTLKDQSDEEFSDVSYESATQAPPPKKSTGYDAGKLAALKKKVAGFEAEEKKERINTAAKEKMREIMDSDSDEPLDKAKKSAVK